MQKQVGMWKSVSPGNPPAPRGLASWMYPAPSRTGPTQWAAISHSPIYDPEWGKNIYQLGASG